MANGYDFKTIEAKWQRIWEETEAFKVGEDSSKPKYYCLEMYPYPSGRIHMGHVRNYSIGDVVARYFRMRGFNVLHPMGWDAFGLPAENAAIEHGIHPATWTYNNIAYMRTQLKKMGFSYDWDREFACSDPDYYRWNQWFFLKLYERGLAYKKPAFVNWCEKCQTVLANEQAEGGVCWRHEDTPVIQKELEQWFLKITAYAEELLNGLDRLDGWPERVKAMQRNWIGKSVGAEVAFPLASGQGSIPIFTTRQDTLYGATFMVMAPEHPLAETLSVGSSREEALAFINRMRREEKTVRTAVDTEKEGVFTGSFAINPMTDERIPIYLANFVLMEYGTGAIMAVPAHDQRDYEFARKYWLPIRVVIQPQEELSPEGMDKAYEGEGVMVASGPFTGLGSEEGREAIVRYLEEKGIGKRAVHYRLRDWGISRQRYWGTPIPILYCASCGDVPVPYDDLPVRLPMDVEITLMGGSPLTKAPEFVNVRCPVCHGPARRETDTMDTFVDSSWYFLRFCSPEATNTPIDQGKARYWMPVDQYIGGIEHAVLHLLYARFFTKVLRDLGLIQVDEPFTNLLTQGMVSKETYQCLTHGYIYPEERRDDGTHEGCGSAVEIGPMRAMSKSKKNVVDPDDLVERYGADTARLFCLFAAPPEKDLEWSDQGVEGSFRFLNRIWRLVEEHADGLKHPIQPIPLNELTVGKGLFRKAHQTIKKIGEDIEGKFHFNTAISALMELVNELSRFDLEADPGTDHERRYVFKFALETLLRLLAPFAPHLSEELWEMSGHERSIFAEPWPSYDPEALVAEELVIVVQVDGKLRSRLSLPASIDEAALKQAALEDRKIRQWLQGREVKQVVVIPKRLVNIVTS